MSLQSAETLPHLPGTVGGRLALTLRQPGGVKQRWRAVGLVEGLALQPPRPHGAAGLPGTPGSRPGMLGKLKVSRNSGEPGRVPLAGPRKVPERSDCC